MNFLARVATLVLSPKQLGQFIDKTKAELYGPESTKALFQKYVSGPAKQRALAVALHPTVQEFAQSKVGGGLVGVAVKAGSAVRGIPAATEKVCYKIHGVTENTIGPALAGGAQTLEQAGNCNCSYSFRQFAAQQVVCWGRHFKRAPAESKDVWAKLKSGDLTWNQVGSGVMHTGYITLYGLVPYTLVSIMFANPAHSLSDHEHAHH